MLTIYLLLISLWSSFQPDTATIYGAVTADSESIPYAAVILYSLDGNVSKSSITDIEGNYKLDAILPGTYTLEVSYVGYTSYRKENIKLSAGDSKKINVRLELGASLEEVIITSDSDKLPVDGRRIMKKERSSVSLPPPPPPAPSMEELMVISTADRHGYADTPVEGKKAGQLTAGEINDFSKWDLWEDIRESDLHAYQKVWNLYPRHRYPVQLIDVHHQPIIDVRVRLVDPEGSTVYSARTDIHGRVELWSGLMGTDSPDRLQVIVDHPEAPKPASAVSNQSLTLRIDQVCNVPDIVDIAWVVDATGSMRDEIEYLQAEITDVTHRVSKSLDGVSLRQASVFYRDHGDEYLTRPYNFSTDVSALHSFFNDQRAAGGGDGPEAVDEALEEAMNLTWSDQARARILFLILDAPPHEDEEDHRRIQRVIAQAAQRGIMIFPVTGSGIGKSTEYLMRSLALATNGSYLFLTNHSGIGGDHIEPSTDDYDVEKFNDMLVRILLERTSTRPCTVHSLTDEERAEEIDARFPDDEDSTVSWSVYPNPSYGPVTVELPHAEGRMWLTDMQGKILRRWVEIPGRRFTIDLAVFPAAGYYLFFQNKEGEVSRQRIISIPRA